MKILLNILKRYGFNIRALTEEDFYAICESEGIHVIETDVVTSFYMPVLGEPTIVLKKGLKGLKRLFVMFHELAHHFAHGGKDANNAFFFDMTISKKEFEADAIATIAILPLSSLENYDFLDEHPRSRFAKQLYKDRQKLWFLHGI